MTAAIGRASVDGSISKVRARITRADLIVVDDIGVLPAGQAAAEAFYRLVDTTYERRSLAVTSYLHPAGFDTFTPKTLATATVDRLLHHAQVITTEGTTMRLAEATAGRGVVPWPNPAGRSTDRRQGDQLSAHREIPMSLDSPALYSDDALDEHRIAIITEQERRANLAQIPEQIEQLAKMYREGGGHESTLRDALIPEQQASREG